MKNIKKYHAMLITVTIVALVFSSTSWLKADGSFSDSERRPLVQEPILSTDTLLSGEY